MDRNGNMALHRENMSAFRYVLSNAAREGQRPAVWAAWGAIIEKRPYLAACLRDMAEIGQEYNAIWLRAGKCSQRGHPHHPLYLKKDEKTEEFDIGGYLETI